MLRPLIECRKHRGPSEERQRGVTMALVALSLVALISMAALSIDLGALYEAKAEAQRAADLGALAAARVISMEGVTGDSSAGPADTVWKDICGGAGSPASLAAINVAQQNLINNSAASTVHVYYGTTGSLGTNEDCTAGTGTGYTVNPLVQVYVQQASLPSFFSRIFSLVIPGGTSNSGVSATATAEVFNPSGSGSLSSGMIPVQPKCVKPWIVPNQDPGNPAPSPNNYFVDPTTGTIGNAGVKQIAGSGVIGEIFTINADCKPGRADCLTPNDIQYNPPQYQANILWYAPAQVLGTPIAVASNQSCSLSNNYQEEIAGCDQTTIYACGTQNGATVDLNENPAGPAGDSATGASCLINYSQGPDSLAGYSPPSQPPSYPFEILAGSGNPLVQAGVAGVNKGDIITVSNSIVTLPIGNFGVGQLSGSQPTVTIVGYIQVFINTVNPDGSMPVTVLNVSGCGDSSTTGSGFNGTSPVPIRLITP
jgi:Putative Flp pilus-assembly TadE/G-like